MITGLNHITLTTHSLDESIAFYCDILGFKGEVRWESGAYLSLNSFWLCLSLDEPEVAKDYTHIAFTIPVLELSRYKNRILKNNIRQWKSNSSEGDSIYILDPAGHQLELHVGNLQSRLEHLREKPYKNLQWLS